MYLEDLVPRVTGRQTEERQHGGAKGQKVGMWVLLTQLVVLGPKQVHPQNGVDEEHEELSKVLNRVLRPLQITRTTPHDYLIFSQASVQSFLRPLQN